MSKQEEIRNYFKDGIANVWADGRDERYIDLDKMVDGVFSYLRSQDVVIKVEKEMPNLPAAYQDNNSDWLNPLGVAYLEAQHTLIKSGYVAAELLVKEQE